MPRIPPRLPAPPRRGLETLDRAGRAGGGGAAFGAPGPKVDLARVLEGWSAEASVDGAEATGADAKPKRVLALSDGTTISFASLPAALED